MKNKLNEKTVVKEKTVLEAGKINKQDFPEVLNGKLQTTTTQDLSRLFFESPASRPDGIFQPLLFGFAGLLQEKGVSQENLKSALLIFAAINSPRLGYPLSLQLMPEDPLLAISLLNQPGQAQRNDPAGLLQAMDPQGSAAKITSIPIWANL